MKFNIHTLFMLIQIFLMSCSWRQKDFIKSLDESVITSEEKPMVIEESISKKFEVKEVQIKKETQNEKSLKNKKLQLEKKPEKLAEIKPSKPKVPTDYPKELELINEKAKLVWDTYRPIVWNKKKMYLDINYLGMTVGKIMLSNKGKNLIGQTEAWNFHARFKSAPFYSAIYELDDIVDTFVSVNGFLSLKFSLTQRESKQSIDELQFYDREKLKNFWYFKLKRKDRNKEKKEETFIPYFSIDPFSVVFFLQGLPLNNGDKFVIPINNKDRLILLTVNVEDREKISTKIGKHNAIRVHVTSQYSGSHLKSGDLTFWFSDDEFKIILKAKAKIKIGSVSAEIVEYN